MAFPTAARRASSVILTKQRAVRPPAPALCTVFRTVQYETASAIGPAIDALLGADGAALQLNSAYRAPEAQRRGAGAGGRPAAAGGLPGCHPFAQAATSPFRRGRPPVLSVGAVTATQLTAHARPRSARTPFHLTGAHATATATAGTAQEPRWRARASAVLNERPRGRAGPARAVGATAQAVPRCFSALLFNMFVFQR